MGSVGRVSVEEGAVLPFPSVHVQTNRVWQLPHVLWEEAPWQGEKNRVLRKL